VFATLHDLVQLSFKSETLCFTFWSCFISILEKLINAHSKVTYVDHQSHQ